MARGGGVAEARTGVIESTRELAAAKRFRREDARFVLMRVALKSAHAVVPAREPLFLLVDARRRGVTRG